MIWPRHASLGQYFLSRKTFAAPQALWVTGLEERAALEERAVLYRDLLGGFVAVGRVEDAALAFEGDIAPEVPSSKGGPTWAHHRTWPAPWGLVPLAWAASPYTPLAIGTASSLGTPFAAPQSHLGSADSFSRSYYTLGVAPSGEELSAPGSLFGA